MVCNLCGINQATVHLTEIVNDQMMEIHICETCAQEKGTEFKTHFNFGELLEGLSDIGIAEKVTSQEEKTQCAECGVTYEGFTKLGRLGCPCCYDTFNKLLVPLIKRVQRSSHHLGKKPAHISNTTRSSHDLRMIQDRLRKCIQSEEFEEAASLRDQIKKIQEIQKKKKKKTS